MIPGCDMAGRGFDSLLLYDWFFELNFDEMAISAEQWLVIATRLQNQYALVEFLLDGRKITVQWFRSSQNRIQYSLIVFIDGVIKIGNGWPSQDDYDPFTGKVWRKRTRTISLFRKLDEAGKTKREIARMKQILKDHPDKVLVWYDCFFNTAQSLVKQYKKLEGLELAEKEVFNG